ncbi:MAG TPA: YicC family protein [Desulfobacterales bacterium]|nr:YicC family protein [Desulfobacterales bacterium]
MSPMSMTAFGRGEFQGRRQWTVEIRTVNHRFCDIGIKIPQRYAMLEGKIKKTAALFLSRGHIEIVINYNPGKTEEVTLRTNRPLARAYYQSLLALNQELGRQEAPDLRLIAQYPGIITEAEPEEDLDDTWAEIEAALRQALEACLVMRRAEGRALKTELIERLSGFETITGEIEASAPELLRRKEEACKSRLARLLDGVEVDPGRLAQEMAILADKSDITEELVRLKSHIQQFRNFLDDSAPVGRRLDFLMQEFLREINTMASKINDSAVIHRTVELKNETEKLREQIQNLE